MKKPEICCIGHITLDKIVTPAFTKHMPGGSAYYIAEALSRMPNADFKLITSVGPNQMGAVEDIRAKGVDVEVIPSRESVYFENKYGENQDHRTQRVLAKADPFTVEKLANAEAKVFHLGSLLADDFNLDVIKYLSTKGKVSVDAQGYLREVRGEQVVAVDWPDKLKALPYIDFLKTNEYEMEVFTGLSDPKLAAKKLVEWGVKEVLLTLGSGGSVIYSEGEIYEIPAFKPKQVVDATGCGDTYMAGYLYKRSLGASAPEAGRFAAAMCTIKLEGSGPFSGTEQDILDRLNA